jgi:hypothetical protein
MAAMISVRWAIPAAFVALGGCVHDPGRRSRVDPIMENRVLASAAAQIRRCYRAPRISTSGRHIVTRLAIRLNADGTLAALPVVVAQSGVTETNSGEAPRMAEAASLAVIRCAPLSLPPELYGPIWQRFELTFSPALKV